MVSMEMFALIYIIDTCTLNVVFASDGLIVSHFSGETMKVDRLLKFMASMVCYIYSQLHMPAIGNFQRKALAL